MKTQGGFLISRIRLLSGRIGEKIVKSSEIDYFNEAQGRIMHVLWENGTLSISGIARLTSLANNTLTVMLNSLEKNGMISKTQDAVNRRRILVSVTEKANDYRKIYECTENETDEIIYNGFTENEIIDFENRLNRIIKNLEKAEKQ